MTSTAVSKGRILVTGANGFIGRHCLPILKMRGFEIHAADKSIPDILSSMVQWHQVDLLDAQQTNRLLKKLKPTHLLHFAWNTTPGEYWSSLENIRWVEGSIRLLHAFHRYGGQRIVMAGTCAEYDWRYGWCSEDLTPLAPTTLYGISKHTLQLLMNKFCNISGMSGAWGRIFFLYGPYENPQRLVPSVILNLLKDQVASCTSCTQIRDFLYIEDVATAFGDLLESSVEGVVNIASGIPVRLSEIVIAAADRLKKRGLVQFGELSTSENEPPLIVGDNRRLRREVGWQPYYDIISGLEKTIHFWVEKIRQAK